MRLESPVQEIGRSQRRDARRFANSLMPCEQNTDVPSTRNDGISRRTFLATSMIAASATAFLAACIDGEITGTGAVPPRLINSVALPGDGKYAGMVSDGAYLYLCEYSNGRIATYSLADRRRPTYLASVSVGDRPRSAIIIGNFLLVVNLGDASVKVYDRAASSLAFLWSFATRETPKDFLLLNDRDLYVICNTGYLQRFTLDFLKPAADLMWEAPTIGSLPIHVSHSNGFLFVCGTGTGTSSIVDIFSSTGSRVGGYEVVGAGGTVAASESLPVGQYLYVVIGGTGPNADQLYVLDVQDPTSPRLATTIRTSDEPAWMSEYGSMLLVSSLTPAGIPGAVDVFDIANPAAPIKVTSVGCTSSGTCFSTIVDHFLYVDGHFAPFNIDVIELPTPLPTT